MSKTFHSDVQVKTIDVEARTVEYVASTEAVDSFGEVVEQDWILERFNKNPVILYNHNKATGGGMFGGGSLPQESTLPIGRSLSHGVELIEGKPALKLKVEFAPESANPFAERVFQLVQAGFLKGGSVGFNPHSVRVEKRNDVDTYVLSRNELFEFSICPIGANPDAVSLSADDVTNHRALLQSLAAHNDKSQEHPNMDLEKMLSEAKALAEKTAGELDTARAELVAKSAAVETAEKAVLELTEANKGLTEKLASETKRADSIEADLVAIEVKSLVGSKLTAAEVDDAVDDRKRLGKVEFAKRMEKRPDLKLIQTKTPTSGPASDLSNAVPGQKTAHAIFSPKGAA